MSTDFSSLDRLVEFGMGVSLAQQMISTMNTAMQGMQVAGVNAGTTGQCNRPCPPFNNAQWYAAIEGRQLGPLNDTELQKLADRREITQNTLMWRPGMSGWKIACDIPEVYKVLILSHSQD